jgi:hypothetical protein
LSPKGDILQVEEHRHRRIRIVGAHWFTKDEVGRGINRWFPNVAFQQTVSRLEKPMLHRKLVAALRRLEIFLVMPTLYLASPAFADQPKKEVHSQADLPRISYPLKGSISTLLQADGSVFDEPRGLRARTDS